MEQQLNQQPSRIPARARTFDEGSSGFCTPGSRRIKYRTSRANWAFKPTENRHSASARVQSPPDNARRAASAFPLDVGPEPFCCDFAYSKGNSRRRAQEKNRGIDHRHLSDTSTSIRNSVVWFKHQACRIVRLRVLLPINEMLLRQDVQWKKLKMRVRQCGAGRSRSTCGPRSDCRSSGSGVT